MLDLKTNFYCESLLDVTEYYQHVFDHRRTTESERVAYGNEVGSYTKLILISKVIIALFEVT
jgi:hypothetical protein